jgi:hypothetical protein
MRLSAVILGIAAGLIWSTATAEEFEPADAMMPEQARIAISQLDDRNFVRREQAANDLFEMGVGVIPAVQEAAATSPPEASVRAFDVLVRLYRCQDERTYEAAEVALRGLMHVSNLSVVARAERVFESVTDIRRVRGIAKFKQLGGIIHADDQNPERQYILLDRGWRGGDEGVRLIECIPQVHEFMQLVIVRGTKVSDEAILDLSLELPKLAIQRRGPARLGVRSMDGRAGCVISAVDPGSAADRAGLQSEDRITEIDGETIDDFKSLIEVIEKKEPGELVPITFHRDGMILNVKAELLPWK